MKGLKKTNLITFFNGKARRVYMDKDGRLFYRGGGQWGGTFREYCYDFSKGEEVK